MHAAMADAAYRLAGRRLLVIGHSGAIRQLRRSLGGDDLRIPNLGGFWFRVTGPVITTGEPVILLGDDVTVVE